MYENTPIQELDQVLAAAQSAFEQIKVLSVKQRARTMRAVAQEIEACGPELIETAHAESNLPLGRLENEKGRTVFQWRVYADAIESGQQLSARIDTADPDRKPPKPDIRKMQIPLGPVLIFGASNFPFAFSTAGGDTASAFAGGNALIIKAHPAHPKTATLMGEAIQRALKNEGLPQGTFSQVYGDETVGAYLAGHPAVQAVGFTGSYAGGKALFDLAAKRETPIPVFAEMGSINPLFLLPEKQKSAASELAASYVTSLTLGAGQFCTNPGLLVAVDGEGLPEFLQACSEAVKASTSHQMLHPGIAGHFQKGCAAVELQAGVSVLARGAAAGPGEGQALLARVSADDFLQSRLLSNEVFGPYGLVVVCKDIPQMERVARQLEGQLTCTFLAEKSELSQHSSLLSIVREKCGRLLLNSFPTGVEVCTAMQHGGPFPASTDSRFTSVGQDAILRFMRPLAFQNWPDELLPAELQNKNPLGIFRTVDQLITDKPI